MVAVATPATSILKMIIKTRFKTTLTSPENANITRGRFVSPAERRIAAPKLKTINPGIPKKYIRTYKAALSKISAGEPIKIIRGLQNTTPIAPTKIPNITLNTIEVCTVR